MEDESFQFKIEIEKLRGIVSPAIFDFLAGTNSSESTSYNSEAPPAIISADDHVPLDDHTLGSDHILPDVAAARASWDEIDAHVEALFSACSQHFEEAEEHCSERIKPDTTPGSSSIKRPFAALKSLEDIAKAKLSADPEKTLLDTK